MKTVVVPFQAHPGQLEIMQSPARFRDVCCGRRWGKTRLASAETIKALTSQPSARVWIVAPTFKVADEDWSMPGGLLDLLHKAEDINAVRLIAELNKADRRVVLFNGSIAEVRTAEREENLRGGGLNLLVLDEAGQISEDASHTLRPTVSDRLGRVIRFGTPRGRNWWYREWLKGQGGHADYQSWQFSSAANPHFPQGELEDAKSQYPIDWFRQEYLAEFLQAAAAVFQKLDARLTAGGATPPAPGRRYVHGLDLAQMQDWTVLTTVDIDTRRIAAITRIQRIPYTEQATIISGVIKRYPGAVHADNTGVGRAVIDNMALSVPNIVPFNFTAESKNQLVGNLMQCIEAEGGVVIPTDGPEFKILLEELRAFEYKSSPTGRAIYNAPSGMHDDCVISLGLAMWGLHRGGASFDRERGYGMRSAS